MTKKQKEDERWAERCALVEELLEEGYTMDEAELTADEEFGYRIARRDLVFKIF